MQTNIPGTLLGTAGTVLWFMPLVNVDFMGVQAYQAGHHIGGIASLLLPASVAYAVLSWVMQHTPRLIAAAVMLAVSALFLVQATSAAAWGLYLMVIVSALGAWFAWKDQAAAKGLKAEAA